MSIRSKLAAIFHVDTPSPTPQAMSFMEAYGRVIEPIKPNSNGRIKLQGVSWLARCSDTLLHPLPIDTPIQVIDRVGLTLLVRPLAIPTMSCGTKRSPRYMVSAVASSTIEQQPAA